MSNTAFKRINAHEVTFKYDSSIVYDQTKLNGSLQVGKAVMITDDATVGLVTTNSIPMGKLIKVESDGFCTVQDQGYCDLPCASGAVTGFAQTGLVGGATAGNVKTGTNPTCQAISQVNTTTVIGKFS